MSALPLRLAGDEGRPPADEVVVGDRPKTPLTSVSTPAPRQLTVRALVVGLALGAVLAAGNVYTGLKSGFIDGGAVTAALLSFTFFATFKRFVRVPFGPFENNVAQTAAASAAVMGFVHGVMGPMPALMMMGTHVAPWALWVWGISLALLGVALAAFLRRKLIIEEALPFPTGTATAELIRTVHANHGDAARRTRFMLVAIVAAGLLTWFRDGKAGLIPQAFYLPMTIGGLTAASLTLGVASSPLMAATGIFIGFRASFSLLLGGAVAWGIVAPLAVRSGWVPDAGYGTLTAWLVWPALGMMMAGTLVPFVIGWRSIGRVLARTVHDARTSFGVVQVKARAGGRLPTGAFVGMGILLLASAALSWTGWRAFGFSPYLTILGLFLSIILATICARAAGETDIAPVGQVGMLTQVLFARSSATGSLLAGAIVAGSASEVAQSMWAFKAGENLRASWRSQIVAQLLGALIGSLIVVPTYFLIVRAYPLGSERMPAVAAISWKATALGLSKGFSGLPSHGLQAAGIAFAVGTLMSLLGRTRRGSFLPSPMAMGVAMLMPVSLSAAAVIGAGALLLARRTCRTSRRTSTLVEADTNALAAGLLVGESVLGVVIAAIAALSA